MQNFFLSGSCIDLFINNLADLLGRICGRKNLFDCGDFNIDWLKQNDHKLTRDFCDTMFNFGSWPLIDKRATLTDNLFKNVHEQLTSGLLLNDISDHLPIFVKLSKRRDNRLVGLNEPTYKLVRIGTLERAETLKLNLASYGCDKVYVDDPNQSYDKEKCKLY